MTLYVALLFRDMTDHGATFPQYSRLVSSTAQNCSSGDRVAGERYERRANSVANNRCSEAAARRIEYRRASLRPVSRSCAN